MCISARSATIGLHSAFEDMSLNKRIRDYHRAMIAHFGAETSLALGWPDESEQQVRFDVLSGIADLNGKTVLDAGCGYADLYPFLKNRFPDLSAYYGIEQ